LTNVYPSDIVENVFVFLTGMYEFLSMIGVITPPAVSIPSDSGVTSMMRISMEESPDKAAA